MARNELLAKAYLDYSTEIYRMCYLYLKDYHLAQDAVSETFIRVCEHISGFKNDSAIKTWIIRIAINVCKDMLRKNSKAPVNVEDIELTDSIPTTKAFSLLEDKHVVTTSIMNLSKEMREVIILYYYMELSTKEIASILKIPRTTVNFRLKKAKDELRVTLKGDFAYE